MEQDLVLYDHAGRELPRQQRNMIFSKVLMPGMPTAQYTPWTVKKAVAEGLKSSVWIYRSFGLISGSAAGVHLRVVDEEDEQPIEGHFLTDVLEQPNDQISRNDCMVLLYNWLLLAGMGYFLMGEKSVSGDGRFKLWPVSPDRLFPIRHKDVDLMIEGYCKDEDKTKTNPNIKYTPDQIIPFRIMDPANPLLGMSPLFAAAKTIDTDSEMQDFNKSAMQNKGVLEGLISYKMPLTQTQIDAQVEAWGEKYSGSSNAKKTAVVGNEAKYERMSVTPQEADFGESSKRNRDVILSACGTPPQLVGAQESSTMDNFRTSETIHWRNTIVPLIGVVVNQLNFFFRVNEMLKPGEKIAPDYSEVQALQQNFKDKTDAALSLFKIGVPVQDISTKLKLGLAEYEGWELPYNGKDVKINPGTGQTTISDKDVTEGEVEKKASIKSWEVRQHEGPGNMRDREQLATDRSKALSKILDAEQATVIDVLESSTDPVKTFKLMFKEDDPFETAADWNKELTKTAVDSAIQEGKNIIVEKRAFDDDLAAAIDAAITNEGLILQEYSFISQHTADVVLTIVADGMEAGSSINEISAALTDTGLFSPERALRISRTIAGTGSSVGQLEAGKLSGANKKTWRTAGFGVRDLHIEREGETVGVNERFKGTASDNGAYPRYPLDPDLSPGDRINCRCSMTFST